MIVEKNDRTKIVLADADKQRRITFIKHKYLPVYSVAINFGDGGGDKTGLKFIRDAFTWIFNETPCIMLRAPILKSNKAARAFATNIPAKIENETEEAWNFVISIQYWINTAKDHNLDKAKRKKPN